MDVLFLLGGFFLWEHSTRGKNLLISNFNKLLRKYESISPLIFLVPDVNDEILTSFPKLKNDLPEFYNLSLNDRVFFQ